MKLETEIKLLQRKLLLILLFIILLSLPFSSGVEARETEEIVLRFEVPKLFQEDILARYDGEHIYLPVIDMFRLLHINLEIDPGFKRLSGRFLNRDNKYYIDLIKSEARCFNNTHSLTDTDVISTVDNLYLRLELYKTIFNLEIYFNFSELSVYLPLDKDFPAYRELKRQAAHEQLQQSQAAIKDIYELPYRRDHLKGGVADWILTLNPLEKRGQYFGLGIGGMILGGDLSLHTTGNSVNGFNSDQLRYRWHYVFKDNRYFSQAEAGEINTGGSIPRSLTGVMITNQPEVQRKYFKTVTVAGQIGEGWEVELYVNNRLVDFATTDQNGEYNFLVDIDYGSTNIRLKMYGPNGEIKIKDEDHRVPYNLIQGGRLEYTLAGGVNENRYGNKKYFQGGMHYGLLDRLTLGFDTDFPIKPEDGEQPLYSAVASFQPFGSVIVNSVYSPRNEASASFSFTKQSLISLSGEYTKYYGNEFRNRMNQTDKIAFSISSPLKVGGRYLGLRYRVSLNRFPGYDVTNMNYGFKIPLFRFHFNYMGNFKVSRFTTRSDKQIASQLFISTSLIRWIRPQFKINFDHDAGRVAGYGLYLQKRIFKRGQLGLSFERNSLTKTEQVTLTFNIFSGFANFSTRGHFSRQNTIVTQTQRGSVRFDQDSRRFYFSRRNGLGLASAVVWPFHDENYNGVLDHGERLLPELKARVGGAQGRRNSSNNLYFYDGLRAYDDYLIQIDPYSLDDPTLQPSHENYRVTISPNVVTSINVPIVTAGGISGMVRREIEGVLSGVGGTRVKVINEVTGKEIVLTTFSDGEFFYLGIVPGMYRIEIDSEQLAQYGYVSEPSSRNFQVKTVEGGDSIDDLNFTIRPKE